MRTIKEIVEARDFVFEEHSVVTDDGYKLKMHRLYSNNDDDGTIQDDKPVVFMQHGLRQSSESFVLNDDDSLAFGFATLGYDVWLGNNRGNPYSREHVKYDPHRREWEDAGKFYDYSFYEMGKFDLPKMIDYVLIETSRDKLSYIGHSQGNTQMFSALAEGHGKLKDQLNLFIALAPTVYMNNVTDDFFKGVSELSEVIYDSFLLAKIYDVFGHKW
jgi:lysosomal acid lipase/cholesteryl ester hydrolase